MSELFAPVDVATRTASDGGLVIASGQRLAPHPSSVLDSFFQGCDAHPDRVLAAERRDGSWATCTWGHAGVRVKRLAQGLLDHHVAGHPVMILSHNSIAHLLVTLAAYAIGSPVVPVSVACSLPSKEHRELRAIAQIVEPAAVFAENATYAAAVEALGAVNLTGQHRNGLDAAGAARGRTHARDR